MMYQLLAFLPYFIHLSSHCSLRKCFAKYTICDTEGITALLFRQMIIICFLDQTMDGDQPSLVIDLDQGRAEQLGLGFFVPVVK